MGYRLRKGRAFAALGILAAVMILFTVIIVVACTKCSDNRKVGAVPEQTATSTVTSATTTLSVMTTKTVTVTHISEPECKGAALYAVSGGRMLYSDNINEKTAPASLTKLLTASVALKYVGNDEVFTVGSEQSMVQPYSSLCGLEYGDMLTMYDLVTGLLMSSGNDAAYTIAVSVARHSEDGEDMSDEEAVEYFCKLMNSFAEEIGMKNSHFTTPDGWDDEDQYTTVKDLIALGEYALSVPEIREISGTFSKDVIIYSGKGFSWKNSNEMLDPLSQNYDEGVIGMKTGTTHNAGNCLVTAYKQKRKTYLAVVVGCETDQDRYDLTAKLLSQCK